MDYMWLVWLVIAIAAFVLEAVTTALVSVWVCAGALVAMILALCGADIVVQIIAMAVVTVLTFVICMIWIKPKLDKKKKGFAQPTNADRCIGSEGVVIKDIDPVDGKGQIKVDGQIWSAKSPVAITEGTRIKVTALEGVKAVVEPVQETNREE
ncbi:MAG: NfeD family protein [Saccharofermentans sp.]|nr:NfeD family protein [Saccharofermentans sp.]